MRCDCDHFLAPLRTLRDVERRCAGDVAGLRSSLDRIDRDASAWRALYRCRVCALLWTEEYPFSERQGGGPACLYHVATDEPHAWLATTEPLTYPIRRAAEDESDLERLGPECGPAKCEYEGCFHLRVALSVFCARHHFEMLRGRPAPPARNFDGGPS